MDFIKYLIDLLIHLDVYLKVIIDQYGTLTYFILFMVIFAETGFVVTPFLPGDSLIFAAATFAAKGAFNINYLFLLLSLAAILGDTINYWIGNYFGPRIANAEKIRFINKSHLEKTHRFFEKYGGKTIIIARFVPIVRTFAPFVAGIGSMTYKKFISYNIIGALLWVGLFSYGGYYFGNLSFVRNNFTFVIFAIIFLSILPPIVEYIRHRRENKSEV